MSSQADECLSKGIAGSGNIACAALLSRLLTIEIEV